MGKVIVVVSGKGGTGKTTAVGAVGSCLGALGKKTLCIDCDAGLRNLDITLGMTNYAAANLNHVTEGTYTLENACIQHPEIENLYFLDAPPYYQNKYDVFRMKKIFEKIRTEYDFCLIDAPAGIGPDVEAVISVADMAVIVTTGDASSIRDGQVMSAKLREAGISDIRLIVNRVKGKIFNSVGLTVDSIIDSVGARLLGIIKDDREVIVSANLEVPLVLHSRKGAVKEFLNVARRIAGEDIPLSLR